MLTRSWNVAIAAAFVMVGAGQADAASTFEGPVVRKGLKMTEAECRWPETSVWVVVARRGECIRYWHAGLRAQNPSVHLFIHGDVNPKRFRSSEREVQRKAEEQHREVRLPAIWLARPGVFGSSGRYLRTRRSLRETRLVDAAISKIKAKHVIGKFHLTGQSSGGRLVAILVSRRADIGCAVSTSGGLAQRKMFEMKGRPFRPFIVDPFAEMPSIIEDSARRIFIAGDRGDTVVPFQLQTLYHGAVKAAGHHAVLLDMTGRGAGRNSHGLVEVGLKLARWCAEGLDDAEIVKRAARIPYK